MWKFQVTYENFPNYNTHSISLNRILVFPPASRPIINILASYLGVLRRNLLLVLRLSHCESVSLSSCFLDLDFLPLPSDTLVFFLPSSSFFSCDFLCLQNEADLLFPKVFINFSQITHCQVNGRNKINYWDSREHFKIIIFIWACRIKFLQKNKARFFYSHLHIKDTPP